MKRTLFIWISMLVTFLLVGCNLSTGAPQDTSPTLTLEAAPGTGVEPTTTALPDDLIAFYPLTSDFSDAAGINTPATATIGSSSPAGIFCNGVCDLTTPVLNGFDINSFTIRTEFLVTKFPVFRDVVFVAGEYRWAKYTLLPDGKVSLGYSDQAIDCTVQYQLNVWHEAAITYDGTTLTLYLDGTPGCSVATPLAAVGGVDIITLRDYGYGSSFSGIAKNLQVFNTVQVPQVRIPLPGHLALTDTTLSPADIILASCPSEAELAAIDSDLTLAFESDPSAGGLVCTAAAGSRDLTGFQRIVYNTLLVMKKLEFNQPLPWTEKQLYDWFVDTVDGIRFRSDIEYSSCCDPAGMINIQTNLTVNSTNKWIDPQLNSGANGLLVLFVHEARHNEIGGHTCGSKDNTRAEMGAWGVQYYLETYLANNLEDPSFLTIPDPNLAAYYSQIATNDAHQVLESSFCQDQ